MNIADYTPEQLFFKDNCVPVETENGALICPRKMFAGGVDKNWEYDFKIKAVVEQKRSDKLKIQQERKRKYEETIKDDN